MVFSIGFYIKLNSKFEKFGITKVGNKYFWIWLLNMVFKSIFSLENFMKYNFFEVITYISLYI